MKKLLLIIALIASINASSQSIKSDSTSTLISIDTTVATVFQSSPGVFYTLEFKRLTSNQLLELQKTRKLKIVQ